ncbi:MAG: hypothetical protein H6633_35725 [Anaerolineales bacterium]|nr:hypothetical protein [Anaerolineales bacterium]
MTAKRRAFRERAASTAAQAQSFHPLVIRRASAASAAGNKRMPERSGGSAAPFIRGAQQAG